MKVLWLTTVIPYPPDTGGKQDPYYMIREFSRAGDEITCGVIFHGEAPPDVPPEFGELVKETFFMPGNPAQLHAQLFSSLADDVPFKFRKYYSEKAVSILSTILIERTFDVVLLDHVHLAPLALECRETVTRARDLPPFVLRAPNVESTIVKKYAERVDNVLVATFAKREARKMTKYEAGILPRFDLVAAISPVDQAHFQKVSGSEANIICVTAGVDTEELQFSEASQVPGEVVFVGSFDWQPNVDGAIWLIKKVWQKVVDRIPGAHLTLVGRKPTEPLKALESETVALTGWVESVREYIEKSSLCVVPLWIGSGMRLKILEAFALGRAVVSTTLGAEGIEYTDGENIVIKDKPDEFADAMVELLQDPERCVEIARKARTLAEEKYSWKTVTMGFRSEITGL